MRRRAGRAPTLDRAAVVAALRRVYARSVETMVAVEQVAAELGLSEEVRR